MQLGWVDDWGFDVEFAQSWRVTCEFSEQFVDAVANYCACEVDDFDEHRHCLPINNEVSDVSLVQNAPVRVTRAQPLLALLSTA